MTLTLSNAAKSASANAAVDLVDGGPGAGKVRIYDGSRPASPNVAVTTQVLLAEVPLVEPAFSAAVNGVKTLDGVPLATTGLAVGTATWFRMVDSNNVAVIDGSAGTTTQDLVLDSAEVTVGVAVQILSGTVTQPG